MSRYVFIKCLLGSVDEIATIRKRTIHLPTDLDDSFTMAVMGILIENFWKIKNYYITAPVIESSSEVATGGVL